MECPARRVHLVQGQLQTSTNCLTPNQGPRNWAFERLPKGPTSLKQRPTASDFLTDKEATSPEAVQQTNNKVATPVTPPAAEEAGDISRPCPRQLDAGLEASAILPKDLAVAGTDVFRPSAPGDSFECASRLSLAATLLVGMSPTYG
ncbi:hypothetical protein HPB50_026079 [Hyalomma asiaticum]|uniref:Uncharacterized protein n=1 Tax=Hyalomma asiaticum TaxID=266040 RepID=A0ACB7RLI0_HYAAI|nr:hypothetical protein HPB50_026079 [Hyalomma asiaticum]